MESWSNRFDLLVRSDFQNTDKNQSILSKTWSNEILKGRFVTPCHFEAGLIGVLLKRRKIRRYSSDAPLISFSPLRSP
ncbi:hypothetical protein YC2023_111467 [Brassica napus]